MKTLRFPQPDGTTLVLTQDQRDQTRWTGQYSDGTTVADRIYAAFERGDVRK